MTDRGYADCCVTSPVTDNSGTYTDYQEGRDDYPRIDYCFINRGFEVTKYDVMDGIYASDHFAIYSDLLFAEEQA